jgi:V/A-type H+-transporting ATPase subunit K
LVSDRPPSQRGIQEKEEHMHTGLMALGAGLAVGLGAIGSGLAQARIGAAAMAAIAEKPELTGRAILMVAIPETLVILGFAVAAMIIVLL